MEIMTGYWLKKEPIVLAIDRTSWRKYNLLVVSWIIQGRAIPINWQLLDKLGSSNLDDQQSVIHPITCLLPEHSFVLLGDREFCSKYLATWLLEVGWGYCLRLKKSTYVRLENDDLVTQQLLIQEFSSSYKELIFQLLLISSPLTSRFIIQKNIMECR